ncbi:MAG: AAA family ATPase [Isosphaeraceae bacterium]
MIHHIRVQNFKTIVDVDDDAHLLAIYQRPPKQILIFEHPEDGIHPGALSILAEEFEAAPEQGRGQIILTTHSPKLLDHFDVEQIRVVGLAGLETRIGFVSAEQKEAIRDKLLDPGELLTVDPARMGEVSNARTYDPALGDRARTGFNRERSPGPEPALSDDSRGQALDLVCPPGPVQAAQGRHRGRLRLRRPGL